MLADGLGNLFLGFFTSSCMSFSKLYGSEIDDSILSVSRLATHQRIKRRVERNRPSALSDHRLLSILFSNSTAIDYSCVVNGGNTNGDLLLERLVTSISRGGLSSINVTFNSISHFPLRLRRKSFFGCRNTHNANGTQRHRRLLESLDTDLMRVCGSRGDLGTFAHTLGLVGFGRRRCLIPVTSRDGPTSA